VTGLSQAATADLRAFQRITVERAAASLEKRDRGTGRFLVADEVGLGKTRVAAALIREIDAKRPAQGHRVVIYFAPNAEVAQQNLRILRPRTPSRPLPGRVTFLPTAMQILREPDTHVLGWTPGTSLRVAGTGRQDERALLLRLLRSIWKCGDSDAVIEVMRDRAGAGGFREQVDAAATRPIDPEILKRFRRELTPSDRAEFFRLKQVVERKGDHLTSGERRNRRELVELLRRRLARACLQALKPRLVILDEFQRYSDVLREAERPGKLEHVLLRRPRTLLLSATPYRMSANDQEATSQVELEQLLRFLLKDADGAKGAMAELEELSTSFIRLRPRDDPDHEASVRRARAAKKQVEARLTPIMSRWQRPHDDEVTRAVPVVPPPDDIKAYLAFQRVVDIAGDSAGLRHRMTVEYWKSAPYLMSFMRGYKVKTAVDEAWKNDDLRKVMARALRGSRGTILPLRDVEQYRAVPVPHRRYQALADLALEHEQWRTLWVAPSCSPYAPSGRFEKAADNHATKVLVFSGWRVVPTAIAALLGYEAERQAGGAIGAKNTIAARNLRNSAQLLSLRLDKNRGLQRLSVLSLIYPCRELATLFDPYSVTTRNGGLPSAREALVAAERAVRPRVRSLRSRQEGKRVDPNWYWAAPMMLDAARGDVHVEELLTSWHGLRRAWSGHGDEALDLALERSLEVVSGQEPLGRLPKDLASVLARLAVAGPAVTALRALSRMGFDEPTQLAAARIGWGMRTLLNRADASLVVRTRRRRGGRGTSAAYWRDALDYCVEGALQGVMDEYIHLLVDEQARPGRTASEVATKVAEAFTAATDLQPLAITADQPSPNGGGSSRRLTSRFAVAFGSARTEEDAGVHPEIVRQAFNSPFWPWVLITTSVGQEGLDFHRYCHHLVHWNVPAGPVELEQREGRVIRFFNHAVRRNVAAAHAAEVRGKSDPWNEMLGAARAACAGDRSGLRPEWVYTGPHTIRRIAPLPAYSRDHERLLRVQRARVYYRLVLGQPNADELVEAVRAAIPVELAQELVRNGLALDLRPRPVDAVR
jgi:hypothetical protein